MGCKKTFAFKTQYYGGQILKATLYPKIQMLTNHKYSQGMKIIAMNYDGDNGMNSCSKRHLTNAPP